MNEKALAEAFECEVNELPLSMVLSWYQGYLLGPSLPAFVLPNVLNFLVENYNIAPIGTVDEDLKKYWVRKMIRKKRAICSLFLYA